MIWRGCNLKKTFVRSAVNISKQVRQGSIGHRGSMDRIGSGRLTERVNGL